MYEVLKRRYAKRENLPDLIMVDGGKGQLGVALAVLKDCGIEGVDVIGLAKERGGLRPDASGVAVDLNRSSGQKQNASEDNPVVYRLSAGGGETGGAPAGRSRRTDTPGTGEDRVFLPGRKDPVYLSRWPAALFLLQRVRDEAHRFAVTYHRKIKEKEDLRSLLDAIPGIGPARKKALLVFFGDVKRIRAATAEELRQVAGIGEETARLIREFLDGGSPAAAGTGDGAVQTHNTEVSQ